MPPLRVHSLQWEGRQKGRNHLHWHEDYVNHLRIKFLNEVKSLKLAQVQVAALCLQRLDAVVAGIGSLERRLDKVSCL